MKKIHCSSPILTHDLYWVACSEALEPSCRKSSRRYITLYHNETDNDFRFLLLSRCSSYVLTLMADKTPEFDKTETSTWDSSWLSEQSSDSLGSQDYFPSRQKRGLIKSCTGYY